MDQARIPRTVMTARAPFSGCGSVFARVIVAGILCFVSLSLALKQCSGAQREQAASLQDFRQRFQNLTSLPPDPCGPHSGSEKDWDPGNSEFQLFSRAAQFVVEALNTTGPDTVTPMDRAVEKLKKLEAESSEINAVWPDESRFHVQMLDAPPVLIVKMTIRTDARYFVFAVPDEGLSGEGKQPWRQVGSDYVSLQNPARAMMELYALHRGPSGNARFLAKVEYFGCAGSIGVAYDAREWNPSRLGELTQIIKLDGAFGLDDKVAGFPQIGRLRTEGSHITLPYCWFSPIDTWDNPSLCAVDGYDLSGDNVRFRARIYNRPDLLPIAKALEYAEQRDYRAVLGYCISRQLAHRLVREVRSHVFAEEVVVKRLGDGRERVELGGGTYRFDVKRRSGRWVVTDFRLR
jgi:hypothetical protein